METLSTPETQSGAPIDTISRPETDLAKIDARLEAVGAEQGERSDEIDQTLEEVSRDAIDLSDRLKSHLGTEVKNFEINGEAAEISKTNLPEGNSVEHIISGKGETTVISLAGEQGTTIGEITINHSPDEIIIDGQPVRDPETAAQVEQVLAHLSQDAAGQEAEPSVEPATENTTEEVVEAEDALEKNVDPDVELGAKIEEELELGQEEEDEARYKQMVGRDLNKPNMQVAGHGSVSQTR